MIKNKNTSKWSVFLFLIFENKPRQILSVSHDWIFSSAKKRIAFHFLRFFNIHNFQNRRSDIAQLSSDF